MISYLCCQTLNPPTDAALQGRRGLPSRPVGWPEFFYVRLSFLKLHKYSIVPSANWATGI